MEPAHTIIAKLGGPTKVATIVGVHRTRVSNWMRPRGKGGTDGVIPNRHVPKLLDYALTNKIRLNRADFVPFPASQGEAA